MNKEELVNLNIREVILNKWKSKLSYPFNHKDLEELESIISYYEEENQQLHNKIDEAIKLYKNCKAEDYCTLDLDMYNVLKGGEVDE